MKKSLIAFCILLIFVLLTLPACQAPAPVDDPTDEVDVEIEITASNYAFSPEVITVQTGQSVRIVLRTTEGTHDWVVDEFDAATAQIGAGETTTVEFVAVESGEFEYYCSVANHRALGMIGTLIVED